MEEMQKKAEDLIAAQQKGLDQYQPAFMVGEQLKDILRREPESAELLAQDLEKVGMGIAAAEKLIADEARKHRKGSAACVPPWIAEDILRKFYGLPERTWGPGKGREATAQEPKAAEAPAKAGSVIDTDKLFDEFF